MKNITVMTEEKFKDAISHSLTELMNRGYEIQRESPIYSVEFRKTIATDVYCIIRFQLIHVPSISMFQVILIRQRMENFSIENSLYKPLYLDLFNMIAGLYDNVIFPPEQYAWEFTDEISLLDKIVKAQSLIINYGIKWLEDPESNIDWVKQSRNPI